MFDRRTFIRKTLQAGVVAAGLPLFLQGCNKGVRREDLPVNMGKLPLDGRILPPETVRILHYASLAPSGHNTQPWSVGVLDENRWIIRADPKRRLPVVDPQNRELLLSIGAFTENLATAAGAFGYSVEADIIGTTPFDRDLVRLSVRKGEEVPYSLKRIETRRTVKKGMTNKELKAGDFKTLSAAATGGVFYIPRDTSHAHCIRDGAIECFRLQTMKDKAQEEFAEWVRLSDRAARKHRDGLTPGGMEISGFGGWYVRNFMDPEDVLKEKFRKQGIELTAELAEEGAGWIIVTSRGDTVKDLIQTGRRFERMALVAREHGVAIHPMTQILEEEEGRSLVKDNHPGDFFPQFILRVGYVSPYPDPVSLRRPVSAFVVPS